MKPPTAVAAIDFGTTYSGYAFSFRSNPDSIHVNSCWHAGTGGLMSIKTPTCVLLKPDGEFDSFGYTAENRYYSLVERQQHTEWRLFQRFKMMLLAEQKLSHTSIIRDTAGRPMEALPIFSMAIRYMKNHLLRTLVSGGNGVPETDILYVLTVPAIWEETAKQFMRQSAEQAGINGNRLKLALEPEVASIWCEKAILGTKVNELGKFMVIDLGGGTADISVFKWTTAATLKQVHKASGGPWGGTTVDKAFLKTLTDIVGEEAITELKATAINDYVDLVRNFETTKRAYNREYWTDMRIQVPCLLKELSTKHTGMSIENRIKALGYGKSIAFMKTGDKMRVDSQIIEGWFDSTLQNMVNHVKEILAETNNADLHTVIVVGGYGESKYVQEKLESELSDKRLIIPDQPSLAVLKGAVRFGHNLNIVASRLVRAGYGIRIRAPFDPEIHPITRRILVNNKEYCESVFKSFVDAGEEVEVDKEVTIKGFKPTDLDSTGVPIFRAENRDIRYTTEMGCSQIGELKIIHFEGDTLEDKMMDLSFRFGGTELEVKAVIQKTGKEASVVIDLLH